jgi:hypothetical protein
MLHAGTPVFRTLLRMLTGPEYLKSKTFISKIISLLVACRSIVGLGRQEIDFVLGGNADDFRDIRQIFQVLPE